MPKLYDKRDLNRAYSEGFEHGLNASTMRGNIPDYFEMLEKQPKGYRTTEPKTKRKPSAYSKRYGAAYKKLKKQHPRMSFGSLSKKAHKEARR